MYRLFVGALVIALVGAFATTRAEDSKATEAFKELEKDFLAKVREVKPEDRANYLKESAKKFIEHAEKNAKDPSAFDALIYVLRMTRPSTDKDDPSSKAMAILKQNHIKNPKIEQWLNVFASRGTDGPALIKKVLEEHPEKKTQYKAAQALVKSYEQMAKMAERIKDDEKIKERLEQIQGKEFVKDLLANADTYAKDAKKYEALIKEKFADQVIDLSVGKKAPEVISKDLDGKEVKLSDLKGKVVVLDIWATWCGPCVRMIPHSRELVKKMEKKPFAFVSVSADAKKETLTEFIKKTPMPWTHWWNGASGGIIADWNVEYFPTIYVLDHKGIIRFKDVRDEKLSEAVEKLVKEAEEDKKEKSKE